MNTVFGDRLIRARKQYVCSSCGGLITPGEQYWFMVTADDCGSLKPIRMHDFCYTWHCENSIYFDQLDVRRVNYRIPITYIQYDCLDYDIVTFTYGCAKYDKD